MASRKKTRTISAAGIIDAAAMHAGSVTMALLLILSSVILIGTVVYAVWSAVYLSHQDWALTETFYDLIYRVLLVVIGIELVRTLITHDLAAIVELVALVIARKLLKPELDALDILFLVLGLCLLLAVQSIGRFLLRSGRRWQ